MANAAKPNLEIELAVDRAKFKRQIETAQFQVEKSFVRHSQKLAMIQQTADAKEIAARRIAQVKQQEADARFQQKLRQQNEMNQQKMRQAQERAQAKLLAGQKSWSRKMVASMKGIQTAIVSMAAAWAVMKIKTTIAQTISWAGEMATFADTVGITVEQFSALQMAALSTGSQITRLENALTNIAQRVADAKSKGGGGTYGKIFAEYGIDTQQNIAAVTDQIIRNMDIGGKALLLGKNSAQVLERIKGRYVDLEGAIKSATESGAILNEQTARQLDDLGAAMERMNLSFRVFSANKLSGKITTIAKSFEALSRISWRKSSSDNTLWKQYVDALDDIYDAEEKAARQNAINEKNLKDSQEREELRNKLLQFRIRQEKIEAEANQKMLEESATFLKGFKIDTDNATRSLGGMKTILEQLSEVGATGTAPVPILEAFENAYNKKLLQDIKKNFEEFTPAISRLTQELFNFSAVSINNDLQRHQVRMQLTQEAYQFEIDAMQAAGLEGTAQYEKRVRQQQSLLIAQRATELRLQSEAWDNEKLANITQTIMNTSTAVMSAWKTGPIMAAIVAAAGAVQLATITAQENPYKRRFGGDVPGFGFGDRTMMALEPGEKIIRRDAASRNGDLLDFINSGGSPSAGSRVELHFHGDVLDPTDWMTRKGIPALQRALDNGVHLKV